MTRLAPATLSEPASSSQSGQSGRTYFRIGVNAHEKDSTRYPDVVLSALDTKGVQG